MSDIFKMAFFPGTEISHVCFSDILIKEKIFERRKLLMAHAGFPTIKKVLTVTASAILAASILAGCGNGGNVDNGPTPSFIDENGIEYYDKTADLQRGCFYTASETGYASPTWDTTSFEPDSSITYSNNNKVAWFDEESWKYIPTIYSGDCIVYRTRDEFDETFYFEKYFDLGYTVGICNLSETQSGRFKFNTKPDTAQINSKSDAYKLTELGDINVTLDAIGGGMLRKENVSMAGTVLGLEKDLSYKAEIYVGTEVQDCVLKADSHALYSMQMNQVTDYEFIEAEIIEIYIPEYFKSGYYSVNGSGIFRYVNGTEYDENTDFNEDNPTMEDYSDFIQNPDKYAFNAMEYIDVDTEGSHTITFKYEDDINTDLIPHGSSPEDMPAPTVILMVGDADIVVADIGNNTYQASFSASPGTYAVNVRNIYGRTYTITVS